MAGAASIFVLRFADEEVRFFANVDAALDFMRELMRYEDGGLELFQLSRYELDADTQQYLFDHDYDLAELVSDSDDDDYSYIDTTTGSE